MFFIVCELVALNTWLLSVAYRPKVPTNENKQEHAAALLPFLLANPNQLLIVRLNIRRVAGLI